MRFVVTGGCGFIGSHLVDYLVAEGHTVVAVDDLSSGKRENLNPAANLFTMSIIDPALPTALEKADGIFHLAAIASPVRSYENWFQAHQVNQSGTVAIFEYAMRHNIPVVYASSAAVYGNIKEIPITEETPTLPVNTYGVDKLACEWQARVGKNLHKLRSCGLRFFNVYGPRQRPDSMYAGVISTFAGRLMSGESMIIHGEGKQMRDFVFVTDVAQTLIKTMEALLNDMPLPLAMNVCTGFGTDVNTLAAVMQQVWQRTVPLETAPDRRGDIRISVGSPELLRSALTLPKFRTLQEGLKEYAASLVPAF